MRLRVPHVALNLDDELGAPRGDVEAGVGAAEERRHAPDAVGDFVVRGDDVEPSVPELGDERRGGGVDDPRIDLGHGDGDDAGRGARRGELAGPLDEGVGVLRVRHPPAGAPVVPPFGFDDDGALCVAGHEERVERVVGAVVERDPPRADRWADVADVAARLPQFVDGALGGDPLAEDEPAVPKSGVLGDERGDVVGVEVGGVGEAEREPAEGAGELRVLEVVLEQPVVGAVGVRGAEEAGAGDRQSAEELFPEIEGDEGGLVDVGAGEGHAAELALGALVVRSDDPHHPAEEEDAALGFLVRDERADDGEDVAGDGAFGLADDGEFSGRGGGDVGEPRDDAGDGLAGPDRPLPYVDPSIGVGDAEPLRLGRDRDGVGRDR